jgi:hypothetical protein
MKLRIYIFALVSLLSLQLISRENLGLNGGRIAAPKGPKSAAAACAPGSGRTDLDLNNVRALIFTAGDMWWDLNNSAKYEVPKGSNKHSAFASALWIGGVDNGGNLKVAAMTYRQTGNDFWPGPLKLEDASVTSDVCLAYDRHWKITKKEVEEYVLGITPAPSEAIETWPGNGDAANGYPFQLAPFIDLNGDGEYDPSYRDTSGIPEHPAYDISGDLGCEAKLFGDQTIWWVFNDKGNIHSETGGFPIGLEIRAQAFAFATNNALNNMTFYNYEIINRSTFTVLQTYFGQWIDSDVGNYLDDYVGCDVGRGLGYTYNGDADDETAVGYGLNPPAFGLDFFEGPFMDADTLDGNPDPCVEPKAINGLGFGDGIIDNERIGMSKYVYYNNDFSITGNPEDAQDIYNYLRGRWKDGTQMVYDGIDGYGSGVPTNFIFPGDTDPLGVGQIVDGVSTNCLPQAPWDETTAGNAPADRRFLQSAGPFTLAPGAVNTITVGAVWARASSGGPTQSVELLRVVDDDAQALFDNCFAIINGPDAPATKVVELDKEIILLFGNPNTSTVINYRDTTAIPGFGDVAYAFQGYQIFQLKDLTVTVNDLKDPNRARLVAQCDIEDSVSQVINRNFDVNLEENVPVEEVNGANEGLRNSFRITTDQFATGDNRLINHKTYYYLVLSYAVADKDQSTFNDSYLAGRRTQGSSTLEVYTAIPHINSPEFGGSVIQATYGNQPSLTRIEGRGNGGNTADLTNASIETILAAPYWMANPVYKVNEAPVNIKVIDPISVPEGDFEFRLSGLTDSDGWDLIHKGDTVSSFSTLGSPIEQVIQEWGLSLEVKQVVRPGEDVVNGNGYITGSSEFSDNTKRWLTFLQDQEGCENAANWIRSGISTNPDDATCDDVLGLDSLQFYEKVLGGTWAPFALVNRNLDGPAYSTSSIIQTLATLRKTQSVNIVITPDKSKWSRCPVFETNDDANFSEGGAEKLDLRAAPSVDKNGNPDGSGNGMGWFPGYAINVETGERLNIGFGESSRLAQDNGRDMIFNPSPRSILFNNGILQNILGGKHFIYVFNHTANSANDMPRYDEGNFIKGQLEAATSAGKRRVFQDCIWTGVPIGVATQSLLATELNIKLRVGRPYEANYNASESAAAPINNNNPVYRFNTAEIFARKQNPDAAVSALDLINVVPNPYYAYSGYETGQLDNRVKITNLPQDCKISIYTANGTLVRVYDKGDPKTSLDWDLKNQTGITISSGIYIIHVNVPGVGEKVVKWFGVLRPIDLDTF